MPPSTAPEDLKFDVAAPPGWTFSPGDTIIGNVVRHAPIVAPDAIVTLGLIGRLRVRISEQEGPGTYSQHKYTHYRSEWNLINHKLDVISRGPLHLAEGSDESLGWPFSIDIPTEPIDTVTQNRIQKASFLPLNKDNPACHVLPGSFISAGKSTIGSCEAYVEYFLKSELRYIRSGSAETHTVTWPVTLRYPVEEADLFSLQASRTQAKIQSQRLLPGMENKSLSLKQKTLKAFGSSSVPEFHYQVEFTFPYVLQLDHPSPIPITLNVIPQRDKISTNIKEVTPDVHIHELKILLWRRTSVRAPTYDKENVRGDTILSSMDFKLETAFRDIQTPLVISTGKGNEPIDLGSIFQLFLHPNGLTSGKKRYLSRASVYPTFTSWNIRHTHTLEWKVSLTIAGEFQTVGASNVPLRIIGAA